MDAAIVIADPVFRGCTRTATLLGVPLVPLLCLLGAVLLLAMYINLWLMLLAIPCVAAANRLCANDDAYFSVALLRLRVRSCFPVYGLGSAVWSLYAMDLRK